MTFSWSFRSISVVSIKVGLISNCLFVIFCFCIWTKAQSMKLSQTIILLVSLVDEMALGLVFLTKYWTFAENKASMINPLSCRCQVSSGAAAVVDHHGRDLSIDDLLLAVEVEHVDGWHLCGRAAGPRGTPRVGLVHQVCMRVLLQVHELALPWAIVGPVAFGRDDPVPAKLLKVDGERVAAAAGLCRLLVTVEARVAAGSLGAVEDLHFDERLLQRNWKCSGNATDKPPAAKKAGLLVQTSLLTWQCRIFSFHWELPECKFPIATSNSNKEHFIFCLLNKPKKLA